MHTETADQNGPGLYRSEWSRVDDCDFYDCTLATSTLWMMQRCNFMLCEVTDGGVFAGAADMDVEIGLPADDAGFVDDLAAKTQFNGVGRVRYVRAARLYPRDHHTPLWRLTGALRIACRVPNKLTVEVEAPPSLPQRMTWTRMGDLTWRRTLADGTTADFRAVERSYVAEHPATVLQQQGGDEQVAIPDVWPERRDVHQRADAAVGWRRVGSASAVLFRGLPPAFPNAVQAAVGTPQLPHAGRPAKGGKAAATFTTPLQVIRTVPSKLLPANEKEWTELRVSAVNEVLEKKVKGATVTMVVKVGEVSEKKDADLAHRLILVAKDQKAGRTRVAMRFFFKPDQRARLVTLKMGDSIKVSGTVEHVSIQRQDDWPLVIETTQCEVVEPRR